MRATVIVCSDSAAAGTTEDTTGPVLAAGLRDIGCDVGPTTSRPLRPRSGPRVVMLWSVPVAPASARVMSHPTPCSQ
jgi:hypothetical protein